MANETILIVDADEKSQRVLEVSFKKAGYRVVMTDTVIQALEYVHAASPDIVISDTQFPDGTDGFEFIEAVKADPATTNIPFLFLTEERALDQKMRGFELGADDYLTKPVYIKEVTTRVELLLQKRAKDILSGAEADEIEGNLSDITMIDLLQMIEESGRSGSIDLERGDRRAVVTFRDGNIYDAICGKLQGEEAIYRLLLWPEGEFVVRYHDDVGRVDRIEKESGDLLLEGIRRLERWNDQIEGLPPLGSILESDFAELARSFDQLPAEVGRVARLFDGIRTIRDVVDDSPFDDVTSLQVTRRLLDDGILKNVTPDEVSPEQSGEANLASWLENKDGRKRVDTSPGRTIGARTEGNEQVRRETEQIEAEDRDSGPWERRRTQRIDQDSEVTDDGEPGKTRRTAETAAARSEASEASEAESEIGAEGSDSDWKFHFDDVDADDAIRRIEEEERKRRELEAQQLFGDRPASGTLQQTPAVSRESGELTTVTDKAPQAQLDDQSEAGRDDAASSDDGHLTELEEAERKRRALEAETLERQRQLAEEARRAVLDGSPRLPGAMQQTGERPETPSAGISSVAKETQPETIPAVGSAQEEQLDRTTDDITDDEEMTPRRRARRPTPISAPALVGDSSASLEEESERPRHETPLEQTPAERREQAVDEAEAVAREASEDVRQSAQHAAIEASGAGGDSEPDETSEVSEEQAGDVELEAAGEEHDSGEAPEDAAPTETESEVAEAGGDEAGGDEAGGDEAGGEGDDEAGDDEAGEVSSDVAEGLGGEVSNADAFLDDDSDEIDRPLSGSDEIVAVSAFHSESEDDDVESSERVTKRMRPPNYANLTPLGEEVSEPVVGDGELAPTQSDQTQTDPSQGEQAASDAGLDETTAPGELEPAEIEAALELIPPVNRHSQDQEVVVTVYDLTEISERRRANNEHADESAQDRKERIEAAAEAAANKAIKATTGLEPAEFVTKRPDDDPDTSTEVWSNPEMMARVDEIADAWASAPDSALEDTDEYDLIAVPDDQDADEWAAGDQDSIDIAEDDTDPPTDDEAAAAAAADVAELETVELDEDEKAGADDSDEAESTDDEADDAEVGDAEEGDAEEGDLGEESSDVEALSDNSQERSFFTEEFEPESYEYPDEESAPRWMLGVAGLLLLAVVGFFVFVNVSGGDPEGETTETETTVAETTPTEPEEQVEPEEPIDEPEEVELAGLTPEEATTEAAFDGMDVRDSATEVSMLLAGLDPSMAPDAGMTDGSDAGTATAGNELALNGETTPDEATETTPDEPAETTPEEPAEPAEAAPATPEDKVREAERLVNREQFTKAISQLQKLAEEQPDNGKVAYLHGSSAWALGRNNEAIAQFERAKKLGYRPAGLYRDLGGAYFFAGKKDKAKEAYETFLEKQPNGSASDEIRSILQTQF